MKFSLNLKNVVCGIILLVTVSFTSRKKGETGPPGTANVMYSDWITPSASKDSTIDGSFVKVQYLKVDTLTEQIIANGAVLVYFTYGSQTLPLPYSAYSGGKASTMSFIPVPRKIIITRFTHDNTASVTLGNNNKYRVVLIPGGVSTNSTKSKALPIGTKPDLYSDDSRYSSIGYDEITNMFSSSRNK